MPHDNKDLTSWAIWAAWFYLAFVCVHSAIMLSDPQDFAEFWASDLPDEVDHTRISFYLYLHYVYLAVILMCYVPNAVWIYRASVNAHAIDPDNSRIEPGWAVAWFAIPIAAFWMPYRAIKQCWNTSLHGAGMLAKPAPGFFALWWTAWLISEILGMVSAYTSDQDGIDAQLSSIYLDIATTPFVIAAGVMWITIVRRISEAQTLHSSNLDVFD